MSRTECAKLLLRKIESICDESPTLLCGDFNDTSESDMYRILTHHKSKIVAKKFRNTRYISQGGHRGPEGTFNGFGSVKFPKDQIDYIFVDENFEVLSHSFMIDHCKRSLNLTRNGRIAMRAPVKVSLISLSLCILLLTISFILFTCFS